MRLNLALPAFGSNAGGGAIDLGPSLVRVRGRSELGASAGLTALLVGDNSELTGGGVGGTLRASASGAYPGASAGVVLRL